MKYIRRQNVPISIPKQNFLNSTIKASFNQNLKLKKKRSELLKHSKVHKSGISSVYECGHVTHELRVIPTNVRTLLSYEKRRKKRAQWRQRRRTSLNM